MSGYDFAGGSLKLKGVSDKISKKKSKKSKKDKEKSRSSLDVALVKSPSSSDVTGATTAAATASVANTSQIIEKRPNDGYIIIKKPTKTKAELAYEKVLEKRMEEKLLAKAELSHKERVENYNKALDQLSEYNDVPKVSWTK